MDHCGITSGKHASTECHVEALTRKHLRHSSSPDVVQRAEAVHVASPMVLGWHEDRQPEHSNRNHFNPSAHERTTRSSISTAQQRSRIPRDATTELVPKGSSSPHQRPRRTVPPPPSDPHCPPSPALHAACTQARSRARARAGRRACAARAVFLTRGNPE